LPLRKIEPLVSTIYDRCRVCYTCVRECPAKAIRIAGGQAEVIPESCIGCGNCVSVCSQNAKRVRNNIPEIERLLESDDLVAAIVAPSFAADFPDMAHTRLVGMLRALGFSFVNEVGFGADLVARRMRELVAAPGGERFISTACPAVFGYVKRYHPELLDDLAPVVSPMIATARVLHALHGPDLRIIFIGPCISKKIEAESDEVDGEVDEVLTFSELRGMFEAHGIGPEGVAPGDFDPPHAGKGSLFPIGRGLLEAAGIAEDLIDGRVISANGKATFIDAVMEFSTGDVEARFLDVLCCDGCIMGPGMTTKAPPFRRRGLVGRYARDIIGRRDEAAWREAMARFADIHLGRRFIPFDQRVPSPPEEGIREALAKIGKFRKEDELNCGACGYDTCREHAAAVIRGHAEEEMCLPFSIEQLHRTIRELNVSNRRLDETREALIQSEKMASMGQLAAGIAHEVNNPLGVVLMYAHLLKDAADRPAETPEAGRMTEDLKMIVDHADRAKKIVSGLLHFARQNKVFLKPVDVRTLVEDCLKPLRVPEGIRVEVAHGAGDPIAELDRDQILQVLNNLVHNALAAMPLGGTLTLRTLRVVERVRIQVSDTGVGIPKENLKKIFEPFFTTRQIGRGTGLGLAIAYGIVKMHRGDIRVESNADPSAGPTGSTFTLELPARAPETESVDRTVAAGPAETAPAA
jgi:signal transduction histidine kinase/iron only hydrogenase large subunit-like protein